MARLYTILIFLACLLPAALATIQIVPGATWTASNGAHLQAHGAGVIKVNGTFYLIGEDKSGNSAFVNINCYSSTDLVQWHYEGALLSRTASGDLGPNRVVERPKVIYNDKTGKYVMWMHIDSSNYAEAKAGVAISDRVCGKYNYLQSFRPLSFQSRDMGLFKDDDGTAYLLTEDREHGLRINKLTADYLNVDSATYVWKEKIEAPAMVKHKGRYYMFGSHLTGWDANDNVVSSSTSMSSGWTPWSNFAEPGSKTYNSQTSYVLAFNDNTILYMGDRWERNNLQSSTYVWLPLTIEGKAVSMKNLDFWVPHIELAGWRTKVASVKAYAAVDSKMAGGAHTVNCAGCVGDNGGKSVGYIGGPDHGLLTIGGVVKEDGDVNTTLVIRYAVAEEQGRRASVRISGGQLVKLDFLPGTGNGRTGMSVVTVALQEGSNNTIQIGGVGNSWGPDVDEVLVPGRCYY